MDTKIAFLILAALPFVIGQPCDPPKGPCHRLVATNEHGEIRIVNFDELTALTTSNPIQAYDASKEYLYKWSICTNAGQGLDGNGAAQYQKGEEYSLGQYQPYGMKAYFNTSIPGGAIQILLTTKVRQAYITVICDPTASIPIKISAGDADPRGGGPYIYPLTFHHHSACGVIKPNIGQCHKIVPTEGDSQAIFNLDELSTYSKILPLIVNDGASKIKFEFGICINISCNGTLGVGCATPFLNGNEISLGTFTPPSPTSGMTIVHIRDTFMNGAVMLKQRMVQGKQLIFTVICDPKAEFPQNPFVLANTEQPEQYQFFVTHRSGCPIK